MKALAALVALLLLALAGSFTYAHRKLYQRQFEHDLMEQAAQSLKTDPNFSQVSVTFDALDARISGQVAVPSLRDQAQALIDALPGARALSVRNEIRVPASLRLTAAGGGAVVASGWLPSPEWRDRIAGTFSTALPQINLDLAGVQTDPAVLEPAFPNSPVLPELLVNFFASVTNGALSFVNQHVDLSGKVRSEADKVRLLSSASRMGSVPGEIAVDNNLEVVVPVRPLPPAPVRGVAGAGTGSPGPTPGGNDLSAVLRSLAVYFDSGSTVLKPAEQVKVDQAAAAIQRLAPQSRFQIVGFADPSGKAAVNQRLSLKRAEAVAARLSARGVAKRQLEVKAVGAPKSAGGAGSAEAKQQARRVEIILKPANASRAN